MGCPETGYPYERRQTQKAGVTSGHRVLHTYSAAPLRDEVGAETVNATERQSLVRRGRDCALRLVL